MSVHPAEAPGCFVLAHLRSDHAGCPLFPGNGVAHRSLDGTNRLWKRLALGNSSRRDKTHIWVGIGDVWPTLIHISGFTEGEGRSLLPPQRPASPQARRDARGDRNLFASYLGWGGLAPAPKPSLWCAHGAGSDGRRFDKCQHFESCSEQSFCFHHVSHFSGCIHASNIGNDQKKYI